MCTSIYVPIHRLPDDNQFKGACQKSRRDERPQTGAQAPGNSATAKEVPKGRQRYKQFEIKQVMFSVALSGLSFVNALVPGVLPFGQAQAESTPVCGLSRLDFVDLWFGAFPRTAIIAYVEDNAMTIIMTTSRDEAPDGHSDGGFILIVSYF